MAIISLQKSLKNKIVEEVKGTNLFISQTLCGQTNAHTHTHTYVYNNSIKHHYDDDRHHHRHYYMEIKINVNASTN